MTGNTRISLRNSPTSWGAVARLFHWSMAMLLLAQMVLGIMAVAWRLSPVKINLFIWHKSLGVLILVLVLMRLAWRLLNPPPALPSMPTWQHVASRASHGVLYLCMLALPVTGWIINSAANVPLRVFWLFPLPAITAPDRALAEAMKLVHGGLVLLFAAVLAVHIVAAFHHHFFRRDEVLTRMLFGVGKRR